MKTMQAFLLAAIIAGALTPALSKPRATLDMGALSCAGAPGDCEPAQLTQRHCGDVRSFVLAALDRSEPVLTSYRSAEAPSLSRSSRWLNSAAWTADNSLLLVDALNSQVLRYSGQGDVETVAFQGVPSGFKPNQIQAAGKDLWLEGADGTLLHMGSGFNVQTRLDLVGTAPTAPHQLASVYSWTVNAQVLLAFGDFMLPDRTWATGLFAIEPGGRETLLYQMEIDDPGRAYYLLGYPYLATVAGRSYFMKMGRHPTLYEVMPGEKSHLKPVSWQKSKVDLAPLPGKRGAQEAVAIYGAVENSTLPVGLYGWNGYLFILNRKADGKGGTSWFLARVEPGRDRLAGYLKLPTSAHHLTVAAGPKAWAFIEKGRVLGLGRQEVQFILMLDASAIRRMSVPMPDAVLRGKELRHGQQIAARGAPFIARR